MITDQLIRNKTGQYDSQLITRMKIESAGYDAYLFILCRLSKLKVKFSTRNSKNSKFDAMYLSY